MNPSRRSFLLARPVRDPEVPERVAVGEACLARHGVECRICAEACDTRALRFVPALGGIAQLRIDPDLCNGCGDCVAPCPVGAVSLGAPKP